MFQWLSQMVVMSSLLTSYVSVTSQKLPTLPPQPTQDQVSCHDASWEKAYLVPLEGFRIHKALDPYIKKLLQEGRSAGAPIRLSSAYRDCKEQGGLRAAACGIGNYNLYVKPIIACAPPTEPAGRSLHNEGLAVDLACQGYSVFQYSPCYTWMKLHHSAYQLQEHQLEAWHWSTTGH